jgi:hypothetical protein
MNFSNVIPALSPDDKGIWGKRGAIETHKVLTTAFLFIRLHKGKSVGEG